MHFNYKVIMDLWDKPFLDISDSFPWKICLMRDNDAKTPIKKSEAASAQGRSPVVSVSGLVSPSQVPKKMWLGKLTRCPSH